MNDKVCPKCGAVEIYRPDDDDESPYRAFDCNSRIRHNGEFEQRPDCRIAELESENARLRAALKDAIRRPMGVVPESAAEFMQETKGEQA